MHIIKRLRGVNDFASCIIQRKFRLPGRVLQMVCLPEGKPIAIERETD